MSQDSFEAERHLEKVAKEAIHHTNEKVINKWQWGSFFQEYLENCDR